jgi:hypothetical protein
MKLLKFIILTMGSLYMIQAAAVTQIEGQAGGGIVPWGVLSEGEPTVSLTWVETGDYTLSSVAIQASLAKWFKQLPVELSYARQTFDTGSVGLGKVDVDVFGGKLKLHGMNDGYWWPALAVGLQFKRTNADDDFLDRVGADDSDVDFYLAATKRLRLSGGKKLWLNATLRGTKANQIGILGFGSRSENSYKAQLETSVAFSINKKTMVGFEYRMKPDNEIGQMKEDDWWDIFFAYTLSDNFSIVAAYADLGDIAAEATADDDYGSDQRGLYLQIQANF